MVYSCVTRAEDGSLIPKDFRFSSLDNYDSSSPPKHLLLKITDASAPLISCKSKPPLKYRRKLRAEDILDAGKRLFITFFDIYARELNGIQNENILLISHPRIYTQAPLYNVPKTEKDSSLQIVIGLDSKIPESKIVYFSNKVQLPSFLTPKTYVFLNDCLVREKSLNYNTWGIVTKIARNVAPTKSRKLMAQTYIIDETYSGSYGHSDFQFSILGSEFSHFPTIRLHSILRIQKMVVQDWGGYTTGRIYDPRSLTVLSSHSNEPTSTDPNFLPFNSEDWNRVSSLRSWFSKYKNLELKFSEIVGDSVFDLYCSLIYITDSSIRVTDGSICPLKTLCNSPKNHSIDNDIFFDSEFTLDQNLSPGTNVLLINVICEKSLETNTYKFRLSKESEIKKLSSGSCNQVFKELKELDKEEEHANDSIRQKNKEEEQVVTLSSPSSSSSFENSFSVNVTRYNRNDDIFSLQNTESESVFEVVKKPKILSRADAFSQESLTSEFYTCPEEEPFSSSLVPTVSLSSLSSISENLGLTSVIGVIEDIFPLFPAEMLHGICVVCKIPNFLFTFKSSKYCHDCESCVESFLHFTVRLTDGSSSIDVAVTGIYAEALSNSSPKDFVGNKRFVIEYLKKLIGKRLQMSLGFTSHGTQTQKSYFLTQEPRLL